VPPRSPTARAGRPRPPGGPSGRPISGRSAAGRRRKIPHRPPCFGAGLWRGGSARRPGIGRGDWRVGRATGRCSAHPLADHLGVRLWRAPQADAGHRRHQLAGCSKTATGNASLVGEGPVPTGCTGPPAPAGPSTVVTGPGAAHCTETGSGKGVHPAHPSTSPQKRGRCRTRLVATLLGRAGQAAGRRAASRGRVVRGGARDGGQVTGLSRSAKSHAGRANRLSRYILPSRALGREGPILRSTGVRRSEWGRGMGPCTPCWSRNFRAGCGGFHDEGRAQVPAIDSKEATGMVPPSPVRAGPRGTTRPRERST